MERLSIFVCGLILCCCLTRQLCSAENVALGKNTLMYVDHDNNNRAVDGSTEGACSQAIAGGIQVWWVVDLEAEYDIASVEITNGAQHNPWDVLQDFTIGVVSTMPTETQHGDIGIDPCNHHAGAMQPSTTTLLECVTRGQYVAIQAASPMELCEVAIYTASATTTLGIQMDPPVTPAPGLAGPAWLNLAHGLRLEMGILREEPCVSLVLCSWYCLETNQCYQFNYNSRDNVCELLDNQYTVLDATDGADGWVYATPA